MTVSQIPPIKVAPSTGIPIGQSSNSTSSRNIDHRTLIGGICGRISIFVIGLIAGYVLQRRKHWQPAHSGCLQPWSLEKEEIGNLTEDLNTALGVGGHDNQENGVNSTLQVNPETRFDSSGGWRTSSAIVVPPYTMDNTSGLNNSANQLEGPPPRLLDTTGIDFIVARVIQITGRHQANNSGNVIINAFAG
ncbi:hypothetical protein M422DRAFT_52296 [Sphaerobolus stellatus SS14]|uniref:Uncharacterized protein n=1 Tax=Sphaerobolus stellatus (strain SS14) TaxID=990650 RepID=A0A0C9UWW9_SPHS4|nr:hypothetical protein M422DRAFT_52296 [Sphaerobolus stellatus SS14]